MLDKTKGKHMTKKSSAMSVENRLKLAKKLDLNKEDLVWFLKNIFVSRKIDDAEISMRKQSKAFFQISGAGHEGVLVAAAKVLKPNGEKKNADV